MTAGLQSCDPSVPHDALHAAMELAAELIRERALAPPRLRLDVKLLRHERAGPGSKPPAR